MMNGTGINMIQGSTWVSATMPVPLFWAKILATNSPWLEPTKWTALLPWLWAMVLLYSVSLGGSGVGWPIRIGISRGGKVNGKKKNWTTSGSMKA